MACIIPFPNRQPMSGRLLTRDRIELCEWEAHGEGGAMSETISRVVIHEAVGAEGSRDADLVLVYGPDTVWARWGMAREAGGVLLWECAYGADLGLFQTMREALAGLLRHAGELGEFGSRRRVGMAGPRLAAPSPHQRK